MEKRVDKRFVYPKMGFHESVVPQVFDGKISTWRLRDHKLQKGDVVAFENILTLPLDNCSNSVHDAEPDWMIRVLLAF